MTAVFLVMTLLSGLEYDARRVAENQALMAAIDERAMPAIQCGKAAINRSIAAKGYADGDTEAAQKALATALSDAQRECVTEGRIGEISRLIRSAMPAVSGASAQQIARSILAEEVGLSLFSDAK